MKGTTERKSHVATILKKDLLPCGSDRNFLTYPVCNNKPGPTVLPCGLVCEHGYYKLICDWGADSAGTDATQKLSLSNHRSSRHVIGLNRRYNRFSPWNVLNADTAVSYTRRKLPASRKNHQVTRNNRMLYRSSVTRFIMRRDNCNRRAFWNVLWLSWDPNVQLATARLARSVVKWLLNLTPKTLFILFI